jgi:programmed cell death protein 4
MSEFRKKPSNLPETKVGEEGSAKRNILRRGGGGGGGGGGSGAATRLQDDGSLAAEYDSAALDERDPNYDSEEDGGVFTPPMAHIRPYAERRVGLSKMTLTAYKTKVTPIIKEYLSSGDIDDTIANLVGIDAPEYNYEAVKRAVNMSFDASDRERERVSRLLSAGYPEIFSSNMIGKGFERLFELIDEIEKDVPSAREMLSIFLARAVVDEILPPSFLKDAVVCNLGGEIIEHAKRMLSRDHGGARLERVWGPGDGRPVEDMKVATDHLLAEYLVSGDMDEAVRCIKELNAPLFYHEVVKRGVVLVVDKNKEAQDKISALYAYLVERDLLTVGQAVKGFTRLHDLLSDLILDAPASGAVLAYMTNESIVAGVLPGDFSVNDP